MNDGHFHIRLVLYYIYLVYICLHLLQDSTSKKRRGLEIEVDEVNGYKEVEVNILRGRRFVIILRSISL